MQALADLQMRSFGSESTNVQTKNDFELNFGTVNREQTSQEIGSAIFARLGTGLSKAASTFERPETTVIISPYFPKAIQGSSTVWHIPAQTKKKVELHVAAASAINALLQAEERRRIAAEKEAAFYNYILDDDED